MSKLKDDAKIMKWWAKLTEEIRNEMRNNFDVLFFDKLLLCKKNKLFSDYVLGHLFIYLFIYSFFGGINLKVSSLSLTIRTSQRCCDWYISTS